VNHKSNKEARQQRLNFWGQLQYIHYMTEKTNKK